VVKNQEAMIDYLKAKLALQEVEEPRDPTFATPRDYGRGGNSYRGNRRF
jgi:hypothetical protein